MNRMEPITEAKELTGPQRAIREHHLDWINLNLTMILAQVRAHKEHGIFVVCQKKLGETEACGFISLAMLGQLEFKLPADAMAELKRLTDLTDLTAKQFVTVAFLTPGDGVHIYNVGDAAELIKE